MAHTPFLQKLLKLEAEHRLAESTGRPVEEIRELKAKSGKDGDPVHRALRGQGEHLTRRKFLAGAAAMAATAAASWKFRGKAKASGGPRLAVVGSGIAGLTAALTLADEGYGPTIYEGMYRVGGRMLSDRPSAPACSTCHAVGRPVSLSWLDGQVTDVFGSLIDSNHKTMLGLAKRFRLPLIDLLAAEPEGSTNTYNFQDRYYDPAQVDADYRQVRKALLEDLRAAGYPTTYKTSTPAGRALDAMSIYDWIETRVPDGHASLFGSLLDVAYNAEYGAETRDQSSLNLIYLLGYGPPQSFQVYGSSDERYAIQGGVDRLPNAIAEHLGYPVEFGWALVRIAKESDGTYSLTFDVANGSRTVRADIVILAIPFAVLRHLDYSQAGFDKLKQKAIQKLGAGRNGKLHLQFTNRSWNSPGPWGISNGQTFSDTGYQNTWDGTRGQPGGSGILVNYTGGDIADSMHLKHPYGDTRNPDVIADAKHFLGQIEPVFPGLSPGWNGRAAGSMAHRSPFFQCSYSYWRVGQYQSIAGYEQVRQGNIFFAGEHTSVDWQGWMEGGAESGIRAAREVLAQLK